MNEPIPVDPADVDELVDQLVALGCDRDEVEQLARNEGVL